MKRILSALIMLLVFLSACAFAEGKLRGYSKKEGYQYIQLGNFPQEADGTERPILWRVLSVDDHQAYLLSEYVLFNNRVHPDDKAYVAFDAAFNQTEMFALLNGPFEGNPISKEEQDDLKKRERLGRVHIAETCFKDEAFTPSEQALLIEDEELGMVFLATAEDLKNREFGFASAKDRKAYGTEYAAENGLFVYQNGSSPYWTRSQSQSHAYGTRCTKVDGELGYIRCVVMNEGCRPAVRLSLDSVKISSGNGTMDDPFVLAGK